jgi:tetratricopeptide (TPR) repeat protein
LSDYLFLKTATFIGGRSSDRQPLSEEDWDYVVRSLDVITDLDPYFKDPYLLGTGLLTWDAQRFEDAIALLKKGMDYRILDWELPFYAGFNYFYFLNDHANGGLYLMRAAEIPGSPGLLKTLAARITYYAGQSRTALAFLRQMLSDTHSDALRQRLSLRLHALENAVILEDALEQFTKHEGRVPTLFTELVEAGYLAELPVDPYGGEWIILPNGRVFSTSKFADMKK